MSVSDLSVAHHSVEDRSLFFGHQPQCCRIQNIRNELPMLTFRSQPLSLGVAQPSKGIDFDPSNPSFKQSSFPVRSWRYTIRQKWGLDHLATRIEVIHTERPRSSMIIAGPALPRASRGSSFSPIRTLFALDVRVGRAWPRAIRTIDWARF